MLEDPNLEVKSQIEMFKLASDHLAKMRRSGGDGEGDQPKLPGIDALRELMEGTAQKAIRAEFPDLVDEHRVLVAPTNSGGRASQREIARRQRLKEATQQFQPAAKRRASPSTQGGDDSDLQKLLRKGMK